MEGKLYQNESKHEKYLDISLEGMFKNLKIVW